MRPAADAVAAAVGAATDFRAIPVSGFFSGAPNAEGAAVMQVSMAAMIASGTSREVIWARVKFGWKRSLPCSGG